MDPVTIGAIVGLAGTAILAGKDIFKWTKDEARDERRQLAEIFKETRLQLASANRELNEARSELAVLQLEVAKKDIRIIELTNLTSQKEMEIKNLEEEVKTLRGEVADLRTEVGSWQGLAEHRHAQEKVDIRQEIKDQIEAQ